MLQTVGAAAKQGLIRNAPNTVCFVKEVIGRAFDHEDIQRLIADSPVKVGNLNTPKRRY